MKNWNLDDFLCFMAPLLFICGALVWAFFAFSSLVTPAPPLPPSP